MLVGNVISMILHDLMPFSWLRSNKNKKRETEAQKSLVKSKAVVLENRNEIKKTCKIPKKK